MATFAMTVDGKITTRNFSPVDFTSREDKLHLLRQRSLGDAVLIGHSTLKHDNVRLGLPHEELRQEINLFCELFARPAVMAALKKFLESTDAMPYLP